MGWDRISSAWLRCCALVAAVITAACVFANSTGCGSAAPTSSSSTPVPIEIPSSATSTTFDQVTFDQVTFE